MKKIALFMSAAALILIGLGLWERTNVQIRRVNIPCRKMISKDGFTLVHVSDLHLSRFGRYERRLVRLINAQGADAVVITGDFIKSRRLYDEPSSPESRRAFEAVRRFVGGLEAPYGIFACRGNNDFSDDKEKSDLLLETLHQAGVHVLVNETAALAEDLVLLGIDFPWFFRREVADFAVAAASSGQVLQSGPSLKNSYSHYLIGDRRTSWNNYSFSGRFRLSQPQHAGIGFIVCSQFDRGYDRFYRLRRRAGEPFFTFSHHGVHSPEEVKIAYELEAGEWHCFRIDCGKDSGGIRLQARLWLLGSPEPAIWQAEWIDSTAAFPCGTVGLWSAGEGTHQFDELLVCTFSGDTLMAQDFQDMPPGGDPFGWVDFNYEHEAIPWLMAQVPDSLTTVLAAHSPDMIKWAAPAGVDALLSGHTHGGQIRLPFIGPIFSSIDIGRHYSRGLYQWEGTALFVNSGTGTSLVPFRLFCRPEIAVVRLYPAEEN